VVVRISVPVSFALRGLIAYEGWIYNLSHTDRIGGFRWVNRVTLSYSRLCWKNRKVMVGITKLKPTSCIALWLGSLEILQVMLYGYVNRSPRKIQHSILFSYIITSAFARLRSETILQLRRHYLAHDRNLGMIPGKLQPGHLLQGVHGFEGAAQMHFYGAKALTLSSLEVLAYVVEEEDV
jgi:hypothetical protein